MKRTRRGAEWTGCWKANWTGIKPIESPRAAWLSMLGLVLLGALVVAGVVGLWNSPGAAAQSESAPVVEPEPEAEAEWADEDAAYIED